ncbi:MAG: NAD-dependent epimerase/dehydratase family protein [Dehalococcoidales bacterium]|nr:NAD-dependent epimerase/dehydratase family protein [Dehalococcoidales bacterium]
MTKLITGGTGYIGAELARILAERGEETVLFDVVINRHRIEDIENKVKIVPGDVGNWAEVLNVVKENKVSEIYHLGSMLTYMSEINPWASFRTNVIGTYNVLEAARLFGVEKMMFTSTLGTFGLQVEEVLTDISIQRPVSIYGCGKLYGESLGRFFRNKFGLDFRSIRYAHMIGPNVRTPGHWAPPMIQDAILGKPNECVYGTPESTISMIYVRDAARAADMVLQAPKENIDMVNYNITGIPAVTSAKKLEAVLKSRFPQFEVSYKPDPLSQTGFYKAFGAMKVFDDSYARKEWGWQPLYSTPEAIIDRFEQDSREHLRRYGMA